MECDIIREGETNFLSDKKRYFFFKKKKATHDIKMYLF